MKNTESNADGHEMPMQPQDHQDGIPAPGSPSGTNEVGEVNVEKKAVLSAILNYLASAKVQIYDGTQWREPNEQDVEGIIKSFSNGNPLTMVLANRKPAVFQISILESGDVNFLVSKPIENTTDVVNAAWSDFDFNNLFAELYKYDRRFIKPDGELGNVPDDIKEEARMLLEQLFLPQNLSSRGLALLYRMMENGREIQGGFFATREFSGAALAFVYVGATGDDVPEDVDHEIVED